MKEKPVKLSETEAILVKLLTGVLYDVQDERKRTNNRIDDFVRRGDESSIALAEELKAVVGNSLVVLEKDFEDRVYEAVSKLPIMKWFKLVSGIGPRLAGSLVACVQDIEKFATIGNLWSYMGMSVIPICTKCNKIAYRGTDRIRFCQRQARRRWDVHITSEKYKEEVKKKKAKDQESFCHEAFVATDGKLCQHEEDEFVVENHAPQKKYYGGLLLTYSPFGKTTSWKCSVQFVKQGKSYREIYDYHKARYVGRHAGNYTPAHIELMAKRATSKLFLSHMYEMWRKSLGLECGKIWLMEQKGFDFETHKYIPPPHADIYDEIVAD